MKINLIILPLWYVIYSTELVNAINGTEEEIQRLEKSKNIIFKDILTAIDDGVEVLLKINDTAGHIGAGHLELLKRHVTEMNATGVLDEWLRTMNTTQNARRSSKKKKILDIMDIANVFKNKKTDKEEMKRLHTEDLKKRLQQWIADREAEKERIRQYKAKKRELIALSKFEICPRFGLSNKNKDKADKKKVQYPCCRKCCKKSYMGCL